jgi:hypothetical protein
LIARAANRLIVDAQENLGALIAEVLRLSSPRSALPIYWERLEANRLGEQATQLLQPWSVAAERG